MYILSVSVWVAVVICLCFHTSETTVCVPDSKFQVDCNICTCSYNGREYSCTNLICTPIPYENKFYVHYTKDGRKILTPKEDTLIFDDNNKFVTNDKVQNINFFKKITNINDEIPSNNEQVIIDVDSNGHNVKIGRKIPIVNDKFDLDKRSANINDDNENIPDENEIYQEDEELDQNDYENGHRRKIV